MSIKSILTLASLSLILMAPQGFAKKPVDPNLQESRKIVKSFAKTLKGELLGAIAKGGPANSINICAKRAYELAEDFSKKHKITISRTSLKLRNPKNEPDAWQKKVLEQFEKRRKAGETAKKMDYSEVVTTNGQKQFRYMKAIGVEAKCLLCHGSQINKDIQTKLNENYPADKAVGYSEGQIRGAVSITKNI